MSDKEFINSIIEMFDTHEDNEFYTDDEFVKTLEF